MTPTEIEVAARNQYNAISDNFWSTSEILNLIWQACIELSMYTKNIEQVYTTSTVASQQGYTRPTNAISVKRVTYDGRKLSKVTMREDDVVTGFNSSTTATGTPQYYFEWDNVVYLRPIPSTIGTLKIFTVNRPAKILTTSSLEIPEEYHMGIVDYILSRMSAKDKQFNDSVHYLNLWKETKVEARKALARSKRGDSFVSVQDEGSVIGPYLGLG